MTGNQLRLDDLSLEVLRALAEPTRHRLYQELRTSSSPLTTKDLAVRTGLHPNTVRAHLDLLRDVGLVEVDSDGHGGRGRPRHHFRIVEGAPGSPQPQPQPTAAATTNLARVLIGLTRSGGLSSDAARSAGRRSVAAAVPGGDAAVPNAGMAVEGIVEHQRSSGFEPSLEPLGTGRWRISFPTCPYAGLARDAPEIVCSLHEGTLGGLCHASGSVRLEGFTSGAGLGACQAVLAEEDVAVPEPWMHSYASTKHKEAQT